MPNRFIDDFYDIITMIFHYHYQWNKRDERQRNEVAIREHLVYIEALFGRNVSMVELACRAHLASAKETLLRATSRRSLGDTPDKTTAHTSRSVRDCRNRKEWLVLTTRAELPRREESDAMTLCRNTNSRPGAPTCLSREFAQSNKGIGRKRSLSGCTMGGMT